jgi:DNA-binding MarR family transcriptional regulator
MSNLFENLGYLAIASRLKKLSDTLAGDVTALYKESGIDFEAKYFLIFYLLSEKERMSITEISGELGISHPAVNQTAEEMISKDLVHSEKEGLDKRKRYLSLTTKGKKLLNKLKPLWKEIEEANIALFSEAGGDFLGSLNTIESLLKEKSLMDRMKDKKQENVTV